MIFLAVERPLGGCIKFVSFIPMIFLLFQAFLDAVVNLEFQTVESLWREFWRSQDNNNGDECEEEKYLSKYVKLVIRCLSVVILY